MADLRKLLDNFRQRAAGTKAPDPYSVMLRNIKEQAPKRRDGDTKGAGFLGPLPVQNGVASEFSIADSDEGPDYPSIVPTLTAAELNQVLNGDISEQVADKAREFASKRRKLGKKVFAQEGEQNADVLPMFKRVK